MVVETQNRCLALCLLADLVGRLIKAVRKCLFGFMMFLSENGSSCRGRFVAGVIYIFALKGFPTFESYSVAYHWLVCQNFTEPPSFLFNLTFPFMLFVLRSNCLFVFFLIRALIFRPLVIFFFFFIVFRLIFGFSTHCSNYSFCFYDFTIQLLYFSKG